MTRLEIRLLGPTRFLADGEPWRFVAPPRTIPLLAYLARQRGPVSRVAAGAALWPDEPEDVARTNLRRHLHRMREAFPAAPVPWILDDKRTIALNPQAPLFLDVAAFEALIADPATRADAVELYAGDLVTTCDDEWLIVERERLRGRFLDALLELAVLRRRERDFAGCILYAERLLAHDDLREEALRELIAARYESGDRSAALGAYERFARRLYAEMGVEPMPETTALRDAVTANLLLPQAAQGAYDDDVSIRAVGAANLPFVGRAETLGALRSAWVRAARNSGSTVFVSGEPGIGKSRLAAELARIVETQGGRAVFGVTSSPESAPYQPLVEALRRGLPYIAQSAVEPLWLSVVAPLLPEVLSMRPGLTAAEPIEPARARARLHEAFVQLFSCVARMRPLVLVLEDLHWAQADTIDALSLLARRAGGMSLLIVATYPSDSVVAEHPLRDARRTLQRERRAATLALPPLSAGDVARLVEETTEIVDAPMQLAGEVHRSSEGNPLFAWQLLRSYIETRQLPGEGNGEAGVGAAIAARVERLDPSARTVADVAATIGREFSVELLSEVAGWTEDAVFDALGLLMDRHLVRETGAPGFEYGFTHALVANAIYERTEPGLRALRHRRAAQCLERLEGTGTAATIAQHWASAGERVRACDAFARAARQALEVYARADAIEYARQGLALCDDQRRRWELLRVIVTAHANHGVVESWDRALSEFEGVAADLGDDERFAALESRERYFSQVGDRNAQRGVIDAMRDLARRAASDLWQAEALDALGMLESGLGEFRVALTPLRDALAAASSTGDRRLVARVRQHLVRALMRLGEMADARRELDEQRAHCAGGSVEERLDLLWAESSLALAIEDYDTLHVVAAEMLELSTRFGDEDVQAKAHWMLGGAATSRHDATGVQRHYGHAAIHFERLRQPHSLASTLINLGVYYADMGRLEDAIEHYRRGALLAKDCGSRNLVAYALANTADAELLRGNLSVAYASAAEAHETAVQLGEQRLVMMTMQILGSAECASGELTAGLAHLREAAGMCRAADQRTSLTDNLCTMIECLIAALEVDELASRAAELSDLLRENPASVRSPTRALAALAAAARLSGNDAEAQALEERGRASLAEELARCEDDAARAAFRALRFNQALLRSAARR